jgi:hypothetical protein
VRAVEAHKGASAILCSASILGTLPRYSSAIHNTLPQHSATVCNTTEAGGHGFDSAGFDKAGGVIGLGPAGWMMHFCAYIH